MFCGHCGKTIADGLKFCPYCGKEQLHAPEAPSAPPQPGGPTVRPVTNPGTAGPTAGTPAYVTPQTAKKAENHGVRNGWLIIGGVVIFGIIIASVAGSTGSSANRTASATPGSTSQAVTVGSQPAAAKPTAGPTLPPAGNRLNPVAMGQPYTFSKGNQKYTVTVAKVERNANALVKAANSFNETPPDGNSYLAVFLNLKYLEGPQDRPLTTGNGGHRLFADNRFWGAPFSTVSAKPEFSGQDIFPGATVEGWLGAKYLPTNLQADALFVYDDVYFALK